MKSQEDVLAGVKAGRDRGPCGALDGRDYSRLIYFFPVNEWSAFGFSLVEGAEPPTPKPWTEENILAQLRDDVAFGIEKAEGERGISSASMYAVVKMWLWILDDPLQDHTEYHSYGLPFFRQVEAKYSGGTREDRESLAKPESVATNG